ncbi:MAG: hypothetical protein HY303_17605 [Candidatus Wallbacteria bacterium]|nr:hypothetical protein [Candidatus Wallbacteria bacterium]
MTDSQGVTTTSVVLLLTQPVAGGGERRTLPVGVAAMRLAVERTPVGPEVRLVRSRFYGAVRPGKSFEKMSLHSNNSEVELLNKAGHDE